MQIRRLLVLLPFVTALAAPLGATPLGDAFDDPAAAHAVCSGRLAALMSELRGKDDPSAEGLRLRRSWHDALFRASLSPDATTPDPLWRLRGQARRQFASLLDEATAPDASRRAVMAQGFVQRQLATCHDLLAH